MGKWGVIRAVLRGLYFGRKRLKTRPGWHKRWLIGANERRKKSGLGVENGTKNGDDEVREVFGAFVELQPANHAMVAKIFGDARFRNAEMIREERLMEIPVRRLLPPRAMFAM